MFENIKAGWKIASQTRKSILKDKGLFIYPILSAIIVIIEALVIFGTLFFLSGTTGSSLWYIVGLFLLYLVSAFTSTYMLMALMVAYRSFEKGKKMGIREAMSSISSYTMVIFEWALFTAIVLTLLRMLESRTRGVSRLVISALGGAAISLATLFAVPIILDEKTGPIKTIETSVSFIAKNFGSTIGGILCSDLYGLAFILLGFVMIIVAIVAGITTSIFAVAVILLAIAIGLIIFGAVMSTITANIFKLVLYDYTKTGELPEGFDKELMKSAIKQKGASQPNEVL